MRVFLNPRLPCAEERSSRIVFVPPKKVVALFLLLMGAPATHAENSWEGHVEGQGTPFESRWATADPLVDESSPETTFGYVGIAAEEGDLQLYVAHPYPLLDSLVSAFGGEELECTFDGWRLGVDRQEYIVIGSSESTDSSATFLQPKSVKEFWGAFYAGSLLSIQVERTCDGDMDVLTMVYSLAGSQAAADFVLGKVPVEPEETPAEKVAPSPHESNETAGYEAIPESPATSVDLSSLDRDTRMSIEIACSGAKTDGPAPYGGCLERQLRSIEGMSAAPDLSQLDRDTRMSIEIACSGAKTEGPAPYRRCLERQLRSIEGMSAAPDLSSLDRDTRMSIEIACSGAKTEGPAPYRRCLGRQLRSIEGMDAAPDLSRLDRDTRMSIEIACSGAKTEGPAPYRRCLEQQLKSIGM